MKIFKENSYDIVRLYINQLGIMIFASLLYTPVLSMDNAKLSSGLSIVISILSVSFYLALIYYVMWELGAKDKIRIDGGKMEPCKQKGLVMGLYANVPNLILGLGTIISLSALYANGSNGANVCFIIFNNVMRFTASMFMGIINAIFPVSSAISTADMSSYDNYLPAAILFTGLPLLSVAVTHLAYYLGTKEKKLLSLVFGKK